MKGYKRQRNFEEIISSIKLIYWYQVKYVIFVKNIRLYVTCLY